MSGLRAHTEGPRLADRSGNGFAAFDAFSSLVAVIDSQRARRSPEERFERLGRPCPHDGRPGGRGRATFMKGARVR